MSVEAMPLKRWREQRYLTQEELGKAIGVSGTTVNHWERGTHAPTFKNIRALAAFFGVSPDRILLPDPKKVAA
jgi:transcriptional regulator with XRE-family HTH domain